MDNQVFTFAQSYLSTILSLNILLATGNGLLFIQQNQSRCYRLFILISIVICLISIILIFYSYKEFFVFLIKFDPKADMNIFQPFKPLGWVFRLDILSIIITSLVFLCGICNKEQKQ